MATGSASSNLDANLLASMAAPAANAGGVGGPGNGGSQPAAPAAAAPTNFRQEAKEVWQCVALLSLTVPALKAVYTDEVIERLADVWGPVFERHNFDLGRFMMYFAAGTATLPVLGQTVVAIKEHRAELARQAKEKTEPAPAA